MSAAGQIAGRTFAALAVPNYRKYYIGQIISNAGTWMQSMALSWLVYKLTDSAVALGIVSFSSYLPFGIATMMYLTSPAYLRTLIDHPFGPTMIGGAIGFVIAGHFVIQRIVRIQV